MRFTVLLAETRSECMVRSSKYADHATCGFLPKRLSSEIRSFNVYTLVGSKHKIYFAADFMSHIDNGPSATHALLCDVLSWVSVLSTAVINPPTLNMTKSHSLQRRSWLVWRNLDWQICLQPLPLLWLFPRKLNLAVTHAGIDTEHWLYACC